MDADRRKEIVANIKDELDLLAEPDGEDDIHVAIFERGVVHGRNIAIDQMVAWVKAYTDDPAMKMMFAFVAEDLRNRAENWWK